MLADLVEVVIGVDTRRDTHTAAVLDTRTGGVTADPDGYVELVALAGQHSRLRARALEGSGGYGAGLARHLADAGELVVELDRPQRPARCAGAKSDPIDAERAARHLTRHWSVHAGVAGWSWIPPLRERLTCGQGSLHLPGDLVRHLRCGGELDPLSA